MKCFQMDENANMEANLTTDINVELYVNVGLSF